MSTPVSGMVRNLEKVLWRAALTADRELANKVREEGRRLVFILNGLLRTSRLYDQENAAFEVPCRDFSNLLRELIQLLGAIHIICVEDQIYVNDIRLRISSGEQVVVDSFIEEIGKHAVGGISFHGELDPGEIKTLAMAMGQPPLDQYRPRAALAEAISSLANVEVFGRYRFKVGGEQVSARAKDLEEAMSKCMSVVREAIDNLAADKLPNPLPVRRAVMDLVDGLRSDIGVGLASSVRQGQAVKGEQHLVTVSTLAVLLGQAIGLPDAALSDLGVAALLHDVGAARLPDWTGHTSAGARMLARQRGFHEAKIRRILIALEHHMPYHEDGGDPSRMPTLFSRILHIVDDYDILAAHQPGQPAALSPARALGCMWAVRGARYDPDLLTVFVRLLGRYPPGTLIELTDGRWAVSISGARDQDRFELPIVCIIRDKVGQTTDGKEVIDLYEARETLRPRLVLDLTVEMERSVVSMLEGALKNPLQPETQALPVPSDAEPVS